MESSNGTMEPGDETRRDEIGREDEASNEKTSRRIEEGGREGRRGEDALNVSHPLPRQEIGAT